MSFRGIEDGPQGQDEPSGVLNSGVLTQTQVNNSQLPQRANTIMPMGPGVDVSSILSPLLDGSFAQAQGQAAVMAGVRVPQHNGAAPLAGDAQDDSMPKGTTPLPGTAPLADIHRGPGTAPLIQVPPQVVQGIVQRVVAG